VATMNAEDFAAALAEAVASQHDEADGWLSTRQIRAAIPISKDRLNNTLHMLKAEGRLLVELRPRENLLGVYRPTPCYKIVAPET